MGMSNLAGKTALVTGAASGIGRATALAFAQRGAGLVICDVNEKGMEQVTGQIRDLGREVFARRVDVASREEMKDFAVAVHERVEAVDILMNNAGVGLAAGLLDTTLDDWEWILGINLWGVIHGCHFFLPAMVRGGRGGHVINVSSSAGFTPSELLLAYCATKFAVLGLSESLRAELRPYGIGVTAVCPGIIHTGIVESARARGAQATEVARQQSREMFRRRNYTPERVAENIVKAVQKNRAVAPIAPEAWLMYYLKRFAPGLLAWLNRRLKERMQRDWPSA
jgi:NAD(P)-dependent dehydrogenase (short-subunit alcohol dehydrogenase family)